MPTDKEIVDSIYESLANETTEDKETRQAREAADRDIEIKKEQEITKEILQYYDNIPISYTIEMRTKFLKKLKEKRVQKNYDQKLFTMINWETHGKKEGHSYRFKLSNIWIVCLLSFLAAFSGAYPAFILAFPSAFLLYDYYILDEDRIQRSIGELGGNRLIMENGGFSGEITNTNSLNKSKTINIPDQTEL